MADQDIFKQEEPKPIEGVQPTPPINADPFANQLAGIVDETGRQKYEDTSKALDALGHSQLHIKTLQSEKADTEAEIVKLREELARRETVEDFVNKFSKPALADTNVKPAEVPAGLDETAVAKIISDAMAQKDATSQKEINVSKVSAKLAEKFGDSANAVVLEKAKSLGMSVDALKVMSAEQPNLVLDLFEGVSTSKPQSVTPTHSSPTIINKNAEAQEGDKKLVSLGVSQEDLLTGWGNIKKRVHDRNGVQT